MTKTKHIPWLDPRLFLKTYKYRENWRNQKAGHMPANGAMSVHLFLGDDCMVVTWEDFLVPGGDQRLYLGQKCHDGCT